MGNDARGLLQLGHQVKPNGGEWTGCLHAGLRVGVGVP
jgi:hypothetical protein